MQNAIDGLRIADFGAHGAMALCTKYLADHGAEVIKIEGRTYPDVPRVSSPYKDGIADLEHSPMFVTFNSSKYSLALDLKKPKALEIVKKLIAKSDVVTENFAPGQMKKWGLSYEYLVKIKPDIIMMSMSICGQTSKFRGYGPHAAARIGMFPLLGWPDRAPVALPTPYVDFVIPWFGVVALMAALDYRARTGKGQYIDMAQLEAGIQGLTPLFMDFAVNNREQTRKGNRSTSGAPHGVFGCKGHERWCAISVSTDTEWQSFCGVVNDPRLSGDTRFSTILDRKKNENALDSLVEEWTRQHSPEEVMELLQSAGVAAAIVETSEDVIDKDPQIKHRQYFKPVEHPAMGVFPHPGWPAKLSKSPAQIKHAPLVGEQNYYVCTKLLGMSDAEFTELVNAGVRVKECWLNLPLFINLKASLDDSIVWIV